MEEQERERKRIEMERERERKRIEMERERERYTERYNLPENVLERKLQIATKTLVTRSQIIGESPPQNAYVERQIDKELMDWVNKPPNGRYLVVTAPRCTGKTRSLQYLLSRTTEFGK